VLASDTGIACVAHVEQLVATRAVHRRVLGSEVVQIAVSGLLAIETVAVGPKVLAVPPGYVAEV
jgi:hypothetical protein